MKKYVLASPEAQAVVNLKDHADLIANAVMDIVAEDDPLITVDESSFSVTPAPSESEFDRIHTRLCSSSLSEFCDDGHILFKEATV